MTRGLLWLIRVWYAIQGLVCKPGGWFPASHITLLQT